ncbi:hypothetical protein V3C99_009878, partial [Haemonchus contortus]
STSTSALDMNALTFSTLAVLLSGIFASLGDHYEYGYDEYIRHGHDHGTSYTKGSNKGEHEGHERHKYDRWARHTRGEKHELRYGSDWDKDHGKGHPAKKHYEGIYKYQDDIHENGHHDHDHYGYGPLHHDLGHDHHGHKRDHGDHYGSGHGHGFSHKHFGPVHDHSFDRDRSQLRRGPSQILWL